MDAKGIEPFSVLGDLGGNHEKSSRQSARQMGKV